jgi:hypothetical protein
MADKHPYVSGPGNLVQAINHFRNSFPSKVNADTLKKLGYAPKNESYVLNVLRHLELIDDDGNKTEKAAKAFNLHQDSAFHEAFGEIVKGAYSDLFELHGEGSWTLSSESLISFFRTHDQTTAIVGQRQASTFRLLAAYAGYGDIPEPKATKKAAPKAKKKATALKDEEESAKTYTPAPTIPPATVPNNNIGLTVRIEINLPAGGDKETYDAIFKSIRENLLNVDNV